MQAVERVSCVRENFEGALAGEWLARSQPHPPVPSNSPIFTPDNNCADSASINHSYKYSTSLNSRHFYLSASLVLVTFLERTGGTYPVVISNHPFLSWPQEAQQSPHFRLISPASPFSIYSIKTSGVSLLTFLFIM